MSRKSRNRRNRNKKKQDLPIEIREGVEVLKLADYAEQQHGISHVTTKMKIKAGIQKVKPNKLKTMPDPPEQVPEDKIGLIKNHYQKQVNKIAVDLSEKALELVEEHKEDTDKLKKELEKVKIENKALKQILKKKGIEGKDLKNRLKKKVKTIKRQIEAERIEENEAKQKSN